MGLKDLFKKGVDAVVSIKEKATQAVADYKQMVAEVETEAGQWKTFDPDFLRAVLDGRLAAAYDLYVAKTGASPAKAKMLVKKIRPNVVRVYPGILKAQAMETIKDIWPYGMNRLLAFRKSEKEEYTYDVGYVRISPTIDAKFYFSTEFWKDGSVETIEYAITFNNGSMILKKDDVIIEVKDNKAGSINFNENDPEYIPCKKACDLLDAKSNFEMFSEETMKRVEDGEISRETMLAVGTKYGFSFEKDLGSNKLMLKFSGINLAQILKSQYFRYYNRMAALTDHPLMGFKPWESEIFISAYMGASRDVIDFSKFIETIEPRLLSQKEILERGSEVANALGKILSRKLEVRNALKEQMGDIESNEELKGLERDEENNAKELRDLKEKIVAFFDVETLFRKGDNGEVTFLPFWNVASAAAESLFNTFKQYTRTSSIPVRLVQIKWFNDAVVLYFKFDLLKDPNLNSDMRKSFAPVLNGGRLKIEDESGNQKDCLPSELLLSFHTEPSSDVETEIFISMAPDYLRVFRDPRISDDAQPQNLA